MGYSQEVAFYQKKKRIGMAPWFIHSLHPFFYIQKGKFMENAKKTVLEAEEEALTALEKANSSEELTNWKNT